MTEQVPFTLQEIQELDSFKRKSIDEKAEVVRKYGLKTGRDELESELGAKAFRFAALSRAGEEHLAPTRRERVEAIRTFLDDRDLDALNERALEIQKTEEQNIANEVNDRFGNYIRLRNISDPRDDEGEQAGFLGSANALAQRQAISLGEGDFDSQLENAQSSLAELVPQEGRERMVSLFRDKVEGKFKGDAKVSVDGSITIKPTVFGKSDEEVAALVNGLDAPKEVKEKFLSEQFPEQAAAYGKRFRETIQKAGFTDSKKTFSGVELNPVFALREGETDADYTRRIVNELSKGNVADKSADKFRAQIESGVGGALSFFGADGIGSQLRDQAAANELMASLTPGSELISTAFGTLPSLVPAAKGAQAGRFLAGAFKLKSAGPAATALQVGGASLGAGVTSGAMTYGESLDFYRAQGNEDAVELARGDAMRSAAITSLVTAGFGTTGVDKVFVRVAEKKARSGLVARLSELAKQGILEGTEESFDEVAQFILVEMRRDPSQGIEGAVDRGLKAFQIGAILGTGVNAFSGAVNEVRDAANLEPVFRNEVGTGTVRDKVEGRIAQKKAQRTLPEPAIPTSGQTRGEQIREKALERAPEQLEEQLRELGLEIDTVAEAEQERANLKEEIERGVASDQDVENFQKLESILTNETESNNEGDTGESRVPSQPTTPTTDTGEGSTVEPEATGTTVEGNDGVVASSEATGNVEQVGTSLDNRGSDIEAEDIVSPREFRPRNEIESQEQVKEVSELFKSGFVGRPLLVLVDSEGLTDSLTGSHRREAAIQADVEVPIVTISENEIAEFVESDSRTSESDFVDYDGFRAAREEDQLSELKKARDEGVEIDNLDKAIELLEIETQTQQSNEEQTPIQSEAPQETGEGEASNQEEVSQAVEESESDTLTDQTLNVVELPLSSLTLSEDVPQFKEGANEEGVVDQLEGEFDRRGVSPIAVWERNDGRQEVISGRHRLELARRSGEQTIPAQVFREKDGFNAEDAATLDAELNIRDEQGSVKDYAQVFRENNKLSEEAAERGLLSRAKGRSGFALAQDASQETFELHQNSRLTDQQAVALAEEAPQDEAIQRVGAKQLLEGKSITDTRNVMRAARLSSLSDNASQGDLFGSDDSAINAMEESAKKASAYERELSNQINAVKGASKRPSEAAKLGVDVKNPEALKEKLAELEAERERVKKWYNHPDLVERFTGRTIEQPAPDPEPEPQRTGPAFTEEGGDLLSGQQEDFALATQSTVDGDNVTRARQQSEQAQAEQDRNQLELGEQTSKPPAPLPQTSPKADEQTDGTRNSGGDLSNEQLKRDTKSEESNPTLSSSSKSSPIEKVNTFPDDRPLAKEDLPSAKEANETTWYHGGPAVITSPASSMTRIEGLLGSGFYMSDDFEVAKSYAKKGRRVVHKIKTSVRKVINFEEALPPDVVEVLIKNLPPDVADIVKSGAQKGHAGIKVWKDMAEELSVLSSQEGIPISELYENFQGIEGDLKSLGYDAFTHVGGVKTGGKKHKVLILIDPSSEFGYVGETIHESVKSIEPIDEAVAAPTNRKEVSSPAVKKENQSRASLPKTAASLVEGDRLVRRGSIHKVQSVTDNGDGTVTVKAVGLFPSPTLQADSEVETRSPEAPTETRLYGTIIPFLTPETILSAAKDIYKAGQTVGTFTAELVKKVGNAVLPVAKRLFNDFVKFAKEKAFETIENYLDATGGRSFVVPNSGKDIAPEVNERGGVVRPSPAEIRRRERARRNQRRENLQKAREEGLTDGGEVRIRAKIKETKSAATVVGGAARYIAEPISKTLSRIHPTLRNAVAIFEFNSLERTNNWLRKSESFLQGMDSLDKEVRTELERHLFNGDFNAAAPILEENNLTEAFETVRGVLEEARQASLVSGREFNYLENYFPRAVKDYDQFSQFLHQKFGTEELTDIQKAWAEAEAKNGVLTEWERADIAHKVLTQGVGNSSVPSNLKERKLAEIDEEMQRFYEDSNTSLTRYIRTIAEDIEARTFFGKDLEFEAGLIPVSSTFGGVYTELLAEGKVTKKQEDLLRNALQARFNYRSTSPVLGAVRDATYLATMGNLLSAVTQLGDLGFSALDNHYYTANGLARGLVNLAPNLVEGVTLGKVKDLGGLLPPIGVTKSDLNLDRIGQEFVSGTKTSKALNKVFGLVGLSAMDNLGVETRANSTLAKYRRMSDAKLDNLIIPYAPFMTGSVEQVKADIKNRVLSDDVRALLFADVLNVQPRAFSEMPVGYLNNPNGRVLYMLKSFTLKQFDVFRRRGIDDIADGLRKGDTAQVAKGMGNLILTAMVLGLGGAGTDEIKDWMLGREGTMEDRVLDNILKLFGLSKYSTYKFKDGQFVEGVGAVIAPPMLGLSGGAVKDVTEIYNKLNEGDATLLEAVSDTQSINNVPIVGKFYYWRAGKGREKVNKSIAENWEKGLNEEAQSLLEERKELNRIKTNTGKLSEEQTARRKSLNQYHKLITVRRKEVQKLAEKRDEKEIELIKKEMERLARDGWEEEYEQFLEKNREASN